MTTQRDRLAAILTEQMADLDTPQDFGDFAPICTPREYADALFARGVRVVDVRLLTEAIRLNLKAVRLDGMTIEEPVTIDGVEYWRRHPIADKLAEAVLGTLDSES